VCERLGKAGKTPVNKAEATRQAPDKPTREEAPQARPTKKTPEEREKKSNEEKKRETKEEAVPPVSIGPMGPNLSTLDTC